MEFSVWYVLNLTAPMRIPAVTVEHVIDAQFAVGFRLDREWVAFAFYDLRGSAVGG